MHLLDLLIIIILIIGGYKGYQKGFFISLIGFFSLYISLIIAFKYYYVGEFLIHLISSDFDKKTLTVVSIFLVFIISYLLIYQIAKFVKYILDLTLIGLLDDIGGAFLGSLIVGFIMSFLFNVIDWLNLDIFSDQINHSIFYPLIIEIQPLMTKYLFLLIELSPDVWKLFENIEETKVII